MNKPSGVRIDVGFSIRFDFASTLRLAAAVVMALFLIITASARASEKQTRSGYEDVSDLGEGPNDISDELASDDRVKDTLLGTPAREKMLERWYRAKEELNKKAGLQFGLSWTGLYQKATDSMTNQDQAAGGRLQIEGAWTAIGRDTLNKGIFGFRLQDRHRLGTDLAPAALGGAIGSVWTTGYGFNEFDFSLTDCWWEQNLLQGNLSVRVGKYLPFNVFDPFSFKSPLMGFQNAAFNGTPAMALPSFGLGVSAKVRLADDIELIAGLNDANGKPTTSGFDTFFGDHEYFITGELRWRPAFQYGAGKFHLTAWHTDESRHFQRPDGWGATLSGEYQVGRLTPFLRYGWSDGGATPLDHLVAGGMAFGNIFSQKNDLIAIALSWGKPSNRQFDDQSAAEVFYRINVLQFLALTPSVQAVINPARNPDEDLILVFGIRARIAF